MGLATPSLEPSSLPFPFSVELTCMGMSSLFSTCNICVVYIHYKHTQVPKYLSRYPDMILDGTSKYLFKCRGS